MINSTNIGKHLSLITFLNFLFIIKNDYRTIVVYIDGDISEIDLYNEILHLSATHNIPDLVINLNSLSNIDFRNSDEIYLNIILINNNETDLEKINKFERNLLQHDFTLGIIMTVSDSVVIEKYIRTFAGIMQTYRNILFITESGHFLTINGLGVIKNLYELIDLTTSKNITETRDFFPQDDFRDLNHTNLKLFFERKDPLVLLMPININKGQIAISGYDGLMTDTILKYLKIKPKLYTNALIVNNITVNQLFNFSNPIYKNFHRRFFHPEMYTSNLLETLNYRY